MTPEQEQQIKALGLAVGALAGSVGGDGMMGAALGATIAKNAVENNYLSHSERMQYLNAMLSCAKEGKGCAEEKQLAALSDARNSALIAACTGASDSPACKAEQTKLGDAYWSLSMNESTYIKWIKDNGAELAAAALQNGNRSEIASNLLTHTSGLDARYKLTCAEAGRCDPFTTGMLALNGRGQEAIVNATLNLMFEKGGQAAGVGANVGGLAMDALKMNSIYRMIEDSQQAISDYQRIQEIGSWGLIKEKSGGAWTAISGYFGNGWDVATYEIGFNQKWNLADIVGNGFTKGDMGLDAALALVSMGDIAALRAAAKARKVAALEREAVKGDRLPHMLPDEIKDHGTIPHPVKPDPKVAQAERARVSDAEMTRLENLFNTTSIHPRDFDVIVNGKTLKADQAVSIGAPVFPGASTPEVMGYYKELAGIDAMPTVKAIPGKGDVYVAIRPDGSKVTLRSFSSSAQQTGAVWTIEIRHPSINNNRIVEIKFK